MDERNYRIVLETPILSGQWIQDLTLGQYFLNDASQWIFHQTLGYLFQEPESHWYYSADTALGWLFIDETHVDAISLGSTHALNGYAYSQGLQAWIYLSAVENQDGTITSFYFDPTLQMWHTIQGVVLGN